METKEYKNKNKVTLGESTKSEEWDKYSPTPRGIYYGGLFQV